MDKEKRKCTRCSFWGTENDFPRNIRTGITTLKTCDSCTKKVERGAAKRSGNHSSTTNALNDASKTLRNTSNTQPAPMSRPATTRPGNYHRVQSDRDSIPSLAWSEVKELVSAHKKQAFELTTFISSTEEEFVGLEGKEIAKKISSAMRDMSGYRWNFKSTQKSEGDLLIKTHIYYCAQCQGEQTKSHVHKDPKKRRSRTAMDRFHCNGYLKIKTDEQSDQILIKLTHHIPHTPYCDISLDNEVKKIIADNSHLQAGKIWEHVLKEYPEKAKNLTEKQIHFAWMVQNETTWRLDDDQVKSAMTLLQKLEKEGHDIEIIPLEQEAGIHSVAFALRDILEEYGEEIVEIAMDSTWKTNDAGYELYGFVGEANGCALPFAFAFTTTLDESVEAGAKERLMRACLKYIIRKCPNTKFLLTDKDISEINASRNECPNTSHQLCSWHTVRYVDQRLAENRGPRYYDPRLAHEIFSFIDPTWAPGVQPPAAAARTGRKGKEKENESPATASTPTSAEQKTFLPPLMVLISNSERKPIWPAAPTVKDRILTDEFCPAEYRESIKSTFRKHIFLHPEIPVDEEGLCRTAEEIYEHSTQEMYGYCRAHELSQAWAYLWNQWYTPAQWKLWARSKNPLIPHITTTMIVESLWKNLKHKDLAMYHRPRLDLVTHVVITSVLPRVKRALDNLLERRRVGRAQALTPWQKDVKHKWEDSSRSDEERLDAQELHIRKTMKPGDKGRQEKLDALEKERKRPKGKYYSDIGSWVCSCPGYLTSRLLMCKHLIREANKRIAGRATDKRINLKFFSALRRNRSAPFYSIKGIHDNAETSESDQEPEMLDVLVLGKHGSEMTQRARSHHLSSSPAPSSGRSSPIPTPALGPRPLETRNRGEREGEGCSDAGRRQADSGSEDEITRVFPSEARIAELKRRFDVFMNVYENPKGIHPRLSKEMDKAILPLEKASEELERYSKRRRMPRTWKDHTALTMYLD